MALLNRLYFKIKYYKFNSSFAIAPFLPSSLFFIEILAFSASLAIFAKYSPKPTPFSFPTFLNGAKTSIFSSIPIPSSITFSVTLSSIFFSLIFIVLPFGDAF